MILILVIIILIIVFLKGYEVREHLYAYPKIVIRPRLINQYYAPEKKNGVILSSNYFYTIGTSGNISTVTKYNKVLGEHMVTYNTDLKGLQGGISHDGNLYLVSSYKNKDGYYDNKIEMCDINMNYIITFDMNHIDNRGSLVWIDRYEDNWYGMLSYKNNNKTVLIKFNDNWSIDFVWKLPSNLIKTLGNDNIKGGVFDKRTGYLLLSRSNKKMIYLMRINKKKLELLKVINSFNKGKGINFDSTDMNFIWGIKDKEIVKMQLYDYFH